MGVGMGLLELGGCRCSSYRVNPQAITALPTSENICLKSPDYTRSGIFLNHHIQSNVK